MDSPTLVIGVGASAGGLKGLEGAQVLEKPCGTEETLQAVETALTSAAAIDSEAH